MSIEFLDTLDNQALQATLGSLTEGAIRIDAAVPRLSAGGTAFLGRFLAESPQAPVRVVVGIAPETDFEAVAELAKHPSAEVFVHSVQDDGGVPVFNSRCVLFEYPDHSATLLVGSIDWCERSLTGGSIDSGLLLHGRRGESPIERAVSHFAECLREGEPFSSGRVRVYRALQSGVAGDRLPTEQIDFPGFTSHRIVAIHAEGEVAEDEFEVDVPISSPTARRFFTAGRRVELQLYPAGTLFDEEPPAAVPVRFVGQAAKNKGAGACRLTDLREPRLTVQSSESHIPSVTVRLRRDTAGEIPIQHCGSHAPQLKLHVRREGPEEGPILCAQAAIRVPNPALFQREIQDELRVVLHEHPFCEGVRDYAIAIRRADKRYLLGRFVHLCCFQFDRGRIPPNRRQRSLFDGL